MAVTSNTSTSSTGATSAGYPKKPKPYQPATQLSQTEIDLQYSKGIYEHFHVPWNQHNRFLAAVHDREKFAYRDLEHMPPHPFDKQSQKGKPRPSSAPAKPRPTPSKTTEGTHFGTPGATLMDNMVTITGAPCYTQPVVLEADLEHGSPVVLSESLQGQNGWRRTKVQAYKVPPARMGYGEGGARPFHQDYRHYKYYGFAGKGAKTSWAHNPKYTEIYQTVISESPVGQMGTQMQPPAAPLQETIGGPSRPLTEAEQQLAAQFKDHETIPAHYSTPTKSINMNPTNPFSPPIPKRPHSAHSPVSPGGFPRSVQSTPTKSPRPLPEVLEPYRETVSIISRERLPAGPVAVSSREKAKVMTWRQVVPSNYTMTENPSPNHGSQSPFHQRYNHYKYYGFAGKGATSSWARNPKHAVLYD